MDKAEISEILRELAGKITNQMNEVTQLRQLNPQIAIEEINKAIAQSSSSLTALIIKWLESKKEKCKEGEQYWMWNSLHNVYEYGQKTGRNQLITELIGEVR